MRSLKDILPDATAPPPAGTPGTSADLPPDPSVAGCARCGGLRFVRVDSNPDSPEFGRAEPCECALADDAKSLGRRLRAWAGIGADTGVAVPDSTPEEARAWIADPQGWLAVIGPPRSGKAALARAAVAAACERGERGLYIPVADLMERLRAVLRQGGEHAPDAVRRLPYAVIAAFDSADRGTRTAWAGERLATLLEPRWRDGAPTVITCERMPGPAGGDDALRLHSIWVAAPPLTGIDPGHPAQDGPCFARSSSSWVAASSERSRLESFSTRACVWYQNDCDASCSAT